jgi:hypothetical protein
VGALALAGRRANAVGAVRLTLMPGEMEIELVQVAGFSFGFAPGGVAEPVSFRVPFTAVRGLLREGRILTLTFDPAVVTPYNRFALAGFAEDPAASLARAFQARDRARWASFLLPAPLGLLAAALVPEALVGGVLGRASIAVLASLVLFAVLRELWAWRAWGGPESERLGDRFEAELGERLALVDTPVAARPLPPALALRLPARRRARPTPLVPVLTRARPAESARPAERGRTSESARLAFPLAAAVAAAAGIVGVMAFLQRYAAPRPPPPAVDRLATGLGAAARAIRPLYREPPTPERCTCARADSPLWKSGIPALSVLTFHGDDEAPVELVPTFDGKGFPGFDFDLAVVNDGARPLHDVRLTLTFARRSASGQRVGAVDRGLFWSGVLAPGAAVKWKVKAPGSEMRVDASVTGTLDKARLDPAPADAFFHLTSSRFRAVRVHGALMLAYLRDPRAESAARALSATSAADELLIGRIRRAAAPVFACDVRRAEGKLEACVLNGSSQPRSGLAVREVLAAGKEARAVPIPLTIPVHEGRRVHLEVPADLGEDLDFGQAGGAD